MSDASNASNNDPLRDVTFERMEHEGITQFGRTAWSEMYNALAYTVQRMLLADVDPLVPDDKQETIALAARKAIALSTTTALTVAGTGGRIAHQQQTEIDNAYKTGRIDGHAAAKRGEPVFVEDSNTGLSADLGAELGEIFDNVDMRAGKDTPSARGMEALQILLMSMLSERGNKYFVPRFRLILLQRESAILSISEELEGLSVERRELPEAMRDGLAEGTTQWYENNDR